MVERAELEGEALKRLAMSVVTRNFIQNESWSKRYSEILDQPFEPTPDASAYARNLTVAPHYEKFISDPDTLLEVSVTLLEIDEQEGDSRNKENLRAQNAR